ncbi:MAG: hypothetical protein HY270_11400 [Deltaproteobacteria bacterium]|nr:hypothetical protein [Deltaproteobacteria bacterium]
MKRVLPLGVIFILWASAAGSAQDCAAPTSTFDAVQRGVFDLHGCTRSYCHGSGKSDGIDLRAGVSYDVLLQPHKAPDDPPDEPGELLVVPRDPTNSILFQALAAKTQGWQNPAVAPMPLDGLPLNPDELEGIRRWILAGAPQTGFVAGVSALLNPCPPASTDSGPLPACDPSDASLLLPDLKAEPPTDVRLIYQAGHRILDFTTSVDNVGDGPLIIQAATPAANPGQILSAIQVILRNDGSKCAHPAGVIRFADDGQHWAYAQTVNYELRRDDPQTGDLVALSSKTAFCLLDTDPISQSDTRPHQFDAHCTDNIGRMGISVGYKDVYHRIHPSQWIDLDNDPEAAIDPGTYYLVNVANPNNTLWEKNNSREQNMSYRSISVNLSDLNPPSEQAVTPTPTPEMPQPTTTAPAIDTPSRHPSPPVRPRPQPRPTRPDRAPHPERSPRATATPRPDRTDGPQHPSPPPRPERTPRRPA